MPETIDSKHVERTVFAWPSMAAAPIVGRAFFTGFVVLAFLDALSTSWILANGGVELNPISRPWVELGWWGTFAHQFVAVATVYAIWRWTSKSLGETPATAIVLAAFAGKLVPLVTHNFGSVAF